MGGEKSMVILQARDVHKTYVTRGVETPALLGVDLEIEEGEFSALAGPSGSGKTTLLNLFGALDTPTSGEILLDGVALAGQSASQLSDLRLRKLGFIFQAYNLIPVLTARENVEFVMELQGVPKAERRARADELLQAVEIDEMAEKRPLEMSGGQQQRVAVARAIASKPRVVLADEPTANLDSKTAGKLLDLMSTLNTDRGVTFLFSTHDARVIERAHRTIRLEDGRVVADERR
jgi:putative ABC transport system ATP-binding protein